MFRLFIVLLPLVFFSVAGNSYSDKAKFAACTTLLPDAASLVLKQKYPGWRLLDIDDLESKDREIWHKTHADECPSIAIGRYESKSKVQYAVLLIPEKKLTTLKTKLVMLRLTTDGKFIPQVLFDDTALLINYPVIYKASPGQYVDFYDPDKKIEVSSDTVIYDRIGASAVAFYYANGKYDKVLISD